MSLALHWMARAGRSARQIIEAMRCLHDGDGDCGVLPDDAVGPLRALVELGAAKAYRISAPGTPNVTSDELRLVGWLAALQRQRPGVVVSIDPDFAATAAKAAAALRETHLLPIQLVHRAGIAVEKAAWPSSRSSRAAKRQGASSDPRYDNAFHHALLWMRAQAYARERGQVSTKEFGELGLSRQYLSALSDKGVLVRVRHGVYEAPPVGASAPMKLMASRRFSVSKRAGRRTAIHRARG